MTPTSKTKVLEFDLRGEGSLPCVSVVHPALKNSRGNPMLQFRRVLVGRRHTLPLVLLNDGNVTAQVRYIFFYLGHSQNHIFLTIGICNLYTHPSFFLDFPYRFRLTCWISMECSPSKLLLATPAALSTPNNLRAPLTQVQPYSLLVYMHVTIAISLYLLCPLHKH